VSRKSGRAPQLWLGDHRDHPPCPTMPAKRSIPHNSQPKGAARIKPMMTIYGELAASAYDNGRRAAPQFLLSRRPPLPCALLCSVFPFEPGNPE